MDLFPSLGLPIKEDGKVTDVTLGKPADRAGIASGMKLRAVNDRRWSQEPPHEPAPKWGETGSLISY